MNQSNCIYNIASSVFLKETLVNEALNNGEIMLCVGIFSKRSEFIKLLTSLCSLEWLLLQRLM